MTSSTSGPIIVGYDGSDASRSALQWGASQAEAVGAPLRIVHVSSSATELATAMVQINPDPIRRSMKEHLEKECALLLVDRGLDVHVETAIGTVAHELMRVAHSEGASVIVIGMTERGTLGDLISSTTEHVLRRHAVRPVVAVPAAWHGSAADLGRPREGR